MEDELDKRIDNAGKRMMKERSKSITVGVRLKWPANRIAPDVFCLICKQTLNVDVIMEHQFHEKRKWRFDYAILEPYFIAIEVEGGVWTNGRHTRGKGFLSDVEKYNAGTLAGWRIFRVTPDTLITDKTLKMLHLAMQYRP